MRSLKTFALAALTLSFFFSISSVSFAHEGHKTEHKHPYPTQKFSIAAGEKIYNQYCAACHGKTGDGNGPAASAINPKPTNFLDLKYMPIRSRVDHYETTANGRPGTPMPPWKQTLTEKQIWDVIAYIDHLFNHQHDADKTASKDHKH